LRFESSPDEQVRNGKLAEASRSILLLRGISTIIDMSINDYVKQRSAREMMVCTTLHRISDSSASGRAIRDRTVLRLTYVYDSQDLGYPVAQDMLFFFGLWRLCLSATIVWFQNLCAAYQFLRLPGVRTLTEILRSKVRNCKFVCIIRHRFWKCVREEDDCVS
jgi:hypothetical protein